MLDYKLSYNLQALKSFFKQFNLIIHLNLKIDLFTLYEFIVYINFTITLLSKIIIYPDALIILTILL